MMYRNRRSKLLALLITTISLAGLFSTTGPSSPAGALPTGFVSSIVIRNLMMPVNFEFAPDGRIFVAERAGLIKVFDSIDDPKPDIFADLRGRVFTNDGRALLGLALDPRWSTKPFVYVLYAMDGPIGSTPPVYSGAATDNCPTTGGPNECVIGARLSRLSAATNTAGPEDVLVEDWCQQFTTHSIGDLVFDSDGALYASSGDGAFAGQPDYGQRGVHPNVCGDPPSAKGTVLTLPGAEGGALRSQDLRTSGDPTGLNGAIIRINPDTGAGLPDNPLAGSNSANERRVVSYGHRNPWRLAIRPGTKELWIGEVGWNTWEEINRIPTLPSTRPLNFGWPCYEGTSRGYDIGAKVCEDLYQEGAAAVVNPYFQYQQNQPVFKGDTCITTASSVSAMAFYQTGPFPNDYDGAMFFGDYSRRCVFVMRVGDNGVPDPTRISLFHAGEEITDLEVGPTGTLYMLDMFGPNGGNIIRVTYPGNELAPVAVLNATPTSGGTPLPVQFSATGSIPVNPSDRLTFTWDLDGDGAFDDATGAQPTWTYTTDSTTTARLKATDQLGRADIASTQIVAGTLPVPAISTPAPTLTWKVGDELSFTGSATVNTVPLPASALTWDFVLHHCETPTECHQHPLGGFSGVSSGMIVGPDHEYPAYLELQLTATATSGLSATTSVIVAPKTVAVTLESQPPGLRATISGRTGATPFTQTEIMGSSHTIDVTTPQVLAGQQWAFTAWSDLGSRAHDITLGTEPATYRATFTESSGPVPVAAYGFEETSGTTAVDASGSGHNGTVSGPSRTTTGRFGRALTFDGINDSVRVAHNLALSGHAAFTIEAWVRPSIATGVRAVVVKERSANIAYGLYQRGITNRPSSIARTSALNRATGSIAVPADVWTHLATTWDGTQLRIYVNGIERGSMATTGLIGLGNGPLRIGGSSFATEWFKGAIDEVRVYAQAISAEQILTDLNTPVLR